MAKVEIYTTQTCPYCVKAKGLLERKGVEYTEIDVGSDDEARIKLVEKAGGARTVPQIFINDNLVQGGSDGLHKLDDEGKLDEMLNG
ncbi:MAG: glutaredoxin 3 [Micavibrio sp.]|nr:MAG: glutaredoxin 3 [Micavibrio sp.]